MYSQPNDAMMYLCDTLLVYCMSGLLSPSYVHFVVVFAVRSADDVGVGATNYPLSAMVTIWYHIIVRFNVLATKRFIGTWISGLKCISERLIVATSVFLIGGCRLNGLRGILLTFTNPCITRAAGTQGVNAVVVFTRQTYHGRVHHL
jgi:hypothetical protein